jgi:hypothetical protein
MFNVLHGTFPDEDIVNVTIHQEEKPTFSVSLASQSIAENAERNLNDMIVPGAYEPLYKLNVSRDANVLHFTMDKV